MPKEGVVVVVVVGHLVNESEGGVAYSSRSGSQVMGSDCPRLAQAPGSHQNSILPTDELSFDLYITRLRLHTYLLRSRLASLGISLVTSDQPVVVDGIFQGEVSFVESIPLLLYVPAFKIFFRVHTGALVI